MIKRVVPLGFVMSIVLCVVGFSSVASAAECGSSAEGEKIQQGTLLLRPDDSVTELNFKRGAAPRRLIFEFDVKECELPADAKLEVKARSSDLDVESVFGKASIEPEGRNLAVEIPIDPEGFDAGKHTASVTVRGPDVTPTSAKVSVQRSVAFLWPTLISFGFALVGFAGALIVSDYDWNAGGAHFMRRIRKPVLALIAAIGAAWAVWWTGYVQVDVWEWELETLVPLIAGVLTASYGAATGVLQVKGG